LASVDGDACPDKIEEKWANVNKLSAEMKKKLLLTSDADLDGLDDYKELGEEVCDPANDCLTDDSKCVAKSDPIKFEDKDSDGIIDAEDACDGVADSGRDDDKDGIDNACDKDLDNDKLTNDEEKTLGSDPLKADTDGDGLKKLFLKVIH
jgi:hypothetical protein